jgi:hypothetical protein
MSGMGKLAIIVVLLGFLAAALYFAFGLWMAVDAPPMPASGWIAMAGGIIFSLIIGCGLMALVFYSHRHGYDDLTRDDSSPRD